MEKIVVYNLLLQSGRSRMMEEEIVSRVILNAMAYSVGSSKELILELPNFNHIGTDEHLIVTTTMISDIVSNLIDKRITWFKVNKAGYIETSQVPQKTNKQIILSGSFNPVHRGHVNLIKQAQLMLKEKVILILIIILILITVLVEHNLLFEEHSI